MADVTLVDLGASPKWRVFSHRSVRPGVAERLPEGLRWSVSPGEVTVLGPRPPGEEIVDLTHVRAMFRLSGEEVPRLLSKICAVDLGDDMFPDLAAARTLVAGVAAEVVRDDQDGSRSYLVLPSRSYGAYMRGVMLDAGREHGLGA